ncbi:MAG: hypothetical protein IPH12_16790 [Saprospirales bacterium]|nr:hypothetical protein [Saprospirales bacterium]MBK8920227.1 hypothetical protein [Saprospirales bacterium]
MKRIFFYLLFWTLSTAAAGQNCARMYDYFKEGVTLEYTSFDKKDRVESVMTQRVSKVEERADTLVAVFDVTTVDGKGKNARKSTLPIKCHAGIIYVDLQTVVPMPENSEEMADMQMEMRGSDLSFPPGMRPGQTLADADMELSVRMGGVQIMNTQYRIFNRKVEAQESMTTAAGTFDCLKITYDMEYKLLGKHQMRTEYWYSPSVGMVKSVTYDQKGKGETRMELTKMTQ